MGNRMFTNATWMMISNIAQSAIAFVISIFTIRYLGPKDFGLINYAISITSICSPIIYLGFNSIMAAEIVNHPEKEGETMGTILGLSLLSSFVCYITMGLLVYLFNGDDKATVFVCLLYCLIFFLDSINLLDYWVQTKLIKKETTIPFIIINILISIYKIVLLVNNKSVYWFALANVFQYLMLSVYLLYFYKKKSSQKLSFNLKRGKEMLGVSKFYILSTMMITLFTNMDRIMIKNMIGDTPNGYYGTALSMSVLGYFVFGSISESYKPQILKYKANGNEEAYNKAIINLYSLLFYISLAEALVISLLSKIMIPILYGEEYLPSISVLIILMFSTVFNYIAMARDIYVLAEKKYKQMISVYAMAIILNFLLNYILIRVIGVNGAAIATLATYFFTNVVVGFFYKPLVNNNKLLLKGINPKVFMENLVVIKNIILKND